VRYKVAVVIGVVVMGVVAWISGLFSSTNETATGSIYDFRMTALDGKEISLERYKGQNLLIVNTASKCGYTPQYAPLQELHEKYGDRITVLGFPANDFLWQEPGSDEEIAAFCSKNYGVTFQMFSKISVRGRDQHPLFRWLSAKSGKRPSWNFCKYLVNRNGDVVAFYGPSVSPLDESIIKHITN
jgi:glutathione peroxidase